jgi:hypothetical protein
MTYMCEEVAGSNVGWESNIAMALKETSHRAQFKGTSYVQRDKV